MTIITVTHKVNNDVIVVVMFCLPVQIKGQLLRIQVLFTLTRALDKVGLIINLHQVMCMRCSWKTCPGGNYFFRIVVLQLPSDQPTTNNNRNVVWRGKKVLIPKINLVLKTNRKQKTSFFLLIVCEVVTFLYLVRNWWWTMSYKFWEMLGSILEVTLPEEENH